jgi:invasion protein IalB
MSCSLRLASTKAHVVILALCLAGAQAEAQSPVPLQETHGDWRVVCVQENDRRSCVLVQQQVRTETGQLVIRVEFSAMPGDSIDGTIVLPFGVAVSEPVTLLLDDAAVIKRPFRTCLPVGCVVAMSLDSKRVAQFRKAAVLTVKTTIVAPRQEVSFRVSLNGFATALARTAALAQEKGAPPTSQLARP